MARWSLLARIIGVAAVAGAAFAAIALAAGGPGMMGPMHHSRVASFLGYYDGHKVTFLATDTSSRSEAKREHVNFSAKLGASRKTSEEIYMFSGRAAAGQLPVFSSEPGEATYTPLWREEIVTWKAGSTPVLVVRDDQVNALKKKGMVSVRETRTVLNCPIIKAPKAS
jgi:hypothetical protein